MTTPRGGLMIFSERKGDIENSRPTVIHANCGRRAVARTLVGVALCWLGLHPALASPSMLLPQPRGQAGAAPADSLQEAIQLLRQERYQEAEVRLRDEVKQHPSSAEAYFYLGIADLKLGRREEAEAQFRHSLQLAPQSANTLYNLGVLLLDEGKAAQAIPYLERANPGWASQPRPCAQFDPRLPRIPPA